MRLERTDHAATEVKGTELVAEYIAGPETAARLGVPVGTVIGARHVAQDGSQSLGIVSPDMAARIKRRFARETRS